MLEFGVTRSAASRSCGIMLRRILPGDTGADVMKIDCLMGTYGRHALACEALACFLQQSELSNATLLVYNQHPVPLRVEHPKVRVVNEALPAVSLRHIRKRMLELSARPPISFTGGTTMTCISRGT